MRKNAFQEIYCHTAEELRTVIDESENGWDCWLSMVDPPEGDDKACGHVTDNQSSEVVCYIEADTEEQVYAIAKEVKLDGAG